MTALPAGHYLVYLKSYGGPTAEPFAHEPYLKTAGGVRANSLVEAIGIAARIVGTRPWEMLEIRKVHTEAEKKLCNDLELRRVQQLHEFLNLMDPLDS